MKINIVGGGPAGLYFGLLMKKRDPRHKVVIYERNPRDNTFGWGVVFSDQTLSYLERPDHETFREIDALLERWDNVDIVHRGEKVTIRGNRFSGLARIDLLHVLQKRCLELGVELHFESPVERIEDLPPADLLVGADGLRSAVRERFASEFCPSFITHRNRYVWYGTSRVFNGLTLTFRENADGLFVGHSYKFSRTKSTFIVECDQESWGKAGFDQASDEEARHYLERVFAQDLSDQPLLSNASRWLTFVTVRNRCWHTGNVVLLGDALHTAHFSIGSGTKLALEDAIALADAFAENDAVEPSLAAFATARRPAIEKYQDAALRSLAWFENARDDLGLDPLSFAYKAMTRSDKVDHENLKKRDPEFVAAYERRAAAAG
ncbi:MAG TPA: FAD-dependent monooxygenase [Thermoanaerobaculia bacterium]|nr:FAD-dependent monooxygenase [Thermoanaerobaculia bacterium]